MGYPDDQMIYNPYGGGPGWQPSSVFAQSPIPILGSGEPPRYTGPANFNTGMGTNGMSMMLQQMMPFLLSKLANNGRMPAQFFPEQGFYEQLKAQEFYMANQQATQMATQSDTAAVNRTLGGLTQMMTGKPLTEAERTRNFNIASTTSQMMPILTQMLGPDMVDSLHGSRGSAAIFASQLHSALRTSLDPVTGAVGMSGQSAGNISRGVYENLFGDNYNPAELRGMSAGQAGLLAKELQMRGLLGVPIGGLGIDERRAAIPKALSDDTFRRIARDTQAIRELGGDATQEQLDTATAKVRATYNKLRDPNAGPITAEDLADESKLPGGQDLLRTADAARITNRLKGLSGAVKAMREIFGDMGNPNAPMRDIVDGLNKLTQGGLASMSPEKLEMTVRKTQAIAKQTGMSVEGIMALTNSNTQIGDQLGLHRKYSVYNAQQSALFTAAAANTLYLDSGISGQVSTEHLAAADSQLRMSATASPAANQMRAALRMVEKGVATPVAGSKLEAYINAIKSRDTNYDFRMYEADFVDMLKSSGAGPGVVESILRDRRGNQSYGDAYDIGGTVRRTAMRSDAIEKLYGPAVQNALNRSTLASGQALVDSGLLKSQDEFQIMLRDVSTSFMDSVLNTDAATFNNVTARDVHFRTALRNRVVEQFSKKMPGAPQTVINAAADDFIKQSGGATDLTEAIYAELWSAADTDVNAKTVPGMFAMYGDTAQKAMKAGERQAEVDALMGQAFSGLGTAGPLQRVMDILQTSGPEGLTADKLLQAVGSVKSLDVKLFDPNGPLATSLGLWQKNKQLDPTSDADMSQIRFNSEASMALNFGGDKAAAFLTKYGADPRLTGNAELLQLVNAATAADYNMLEEALKISPILGSNISQADMDSISNLGALAGRRLDERDATGRPIALTEKASKSVDDYIAHSTSQAQKLLADKYAMLHLGTGSADNVQAVVTYNQKLQAMAADKKLSLAELLRTDAAARTIFDKSVGLTDALRAQYDTTHNTPMSAAERSDMEAAIKFDAEHTTAKEKQDAALKHLFEVTPTQRRAELQTGHAVEMLETMLTDPGRSSGVAKAARARREILQLAIDKKVFGDKSKIDELTPEEIAAADDRLYMQSLSGDDRSRLDKLKADSSMLESLDSGSRIDLEALQHALEAIPLAQTAAAGESTMAVTVTGTFEEIETGRKIKIVGDGDAVARALMASSIA